MNAGNFYGKETVSQILDFGPLTSIVNNETMNHMISCHQFTFIFFLILSISSIALAGHADDFHQKANWIGLFQKGDSEKKFQIQIIYNFDKTDWPERTQQITLKTPLRIKLLGQNAMKELLATRYSYDLGCETFPTYEGQSSELPNPAEWRLAVPENSGASWAENYLMFAQSKSQPISVDDLPGYEWDRLYSKIFYSMTSEKPSQGGFAPDGNYKDVDLSHLKEADLIPQIKAKSSRSASGLRTKKNIAFIFADVEFVYKGKARNGQAVERKFSVHRAYEPSMTGGFDEIRTPYASGHYWDESYVPNQPVYTNLKNQQHLILRVNGSLRRSVYFLTNFAGALLKHNFSFGPESCD